MHLNVIVFSLGGILAFASFALPRLLRLETASSCALLIACLYADAFGICHGVFGADVATAIVVLSALLNCDLEALALQYRMVHFPLAPKFTRCY